VSDTPEDLASTVVVDTGIFAAVILRAGGRVMRDRYTPLLRGRGIVLAMQTVAELRFAALHGGWSAERRATMEGRLGRQEVAPVDDALVDSYVRLRHVCKRADHPLGYKGQHEQDRWIAATALLYELPLVTHDTVFFEVPGLRLFTALPERR
jgi:predicted nucleic acid-binding protein